jgi:hypothetical protein
LASRSVEAETFSCEKAILVSLPESLCACASQE